MYIYQDEVHAVVFQFFSIFLFAECTKRKLGWYVKKSLEYIKQSKLEWLYNLHRVVAKIHLTASNSKNVHQKISVTF